MKIVDIMYNKYPALEPTTVSTDTTAEYQYHTTILSRTDT